MIKKFVIVVLSCLGLWGLMAVYLPQTRAMAFSVSTFVVSWSMIIIAVVGTVVWKAVK